MTIKRNLRGHALLEYKKKLKLTDIQRDILVGTLLGDASMQAMKGNQEFNVKFEQKIKQADYINHLYEKLQDWVGTPPQIRNITGGNAKNRQSIWFRTYRHSAFTFYKGQFYKVNNNGKQYKVVPDKINKLLTPRALAYWFMDDGTKKKQCYVLNTQGFSMPEQKLLAKTLGKLYGLEVNVWKDKQYFTLAILSGSGSAFVNLIKPYIQPSFLYKL